jgi:hypothetical protein
MVAPCGRRSIASNWPVLLSPIFSFGLLTRPSLPDRPFFVFTMMLHSSWTMSKAMDACLVDSLKQKPDHAVAKFTQIRSIDGSTSESAPYREKANSPVLDVVLRQARASWHAP